MMALPTAAVAADPVPASLRPAAPDAPKRIVSMLPSLTETVCAVGACDRLVGTDRYSDWPDAVRKLPKVGGIGDPSVESILALRPDLVLARPNSRVVPRLVSLGVRVVVYDIKTHADMRRVMEDVAKITGRPGAGEEAWQKVDRQISAAVLRMPPSWKNARVYVEMHGGTAAASESSFIGETLIRLGLRNVVPGNMGPFPRLGPEFIVRARPDVLVTSALSDPALIATRPGWNSLEAVKAGRHCSYGGPHFDMLLRPGPRLGEAADELVDCLRRLGDRPGS
ncbi:MAG: ABC transporter substrate-binding protein [Comamonadaceae bacterium]|nr:MAG: ABC transporter substrate-binding protein [Comamonadaceae bacterium]